MPTTTSPHSPSVGEAGCHCCGMLCLPSTFEHYRQCGGCGAWRSMRPAEPGSFYGDAYWSHARGHSTLREQWHNLTLPLHVPEPFVTSWVRHATAEKPPGARLLEIGCAPGAFLFTMAVRGYAVHGQEVAPGVCEAVAELTGLPAELFTTGLFPDVAPPGPFDLICAFDLLEHALDPAAVLRGMLELLTDDGVLLLQTPVFDATGPAEVHAENRQMWQPDEHVYVFTPRAIDALLQRAGFVGTCERHQLAPGHDLVVARRHGC